MVVRVCVLSIVSSFPTFISLLGLLRFVAIVAPQGWVVSRKNNAELFDETPEFVKNNLKGHYSNHERFLCSLIPPKF